MAVCPAVTSPPRLTVKPVSQAPVRAVVTVVLLNSVLAAGDVMVGVGAELSTFTDVAEAAASVVLPAASVAAPAATDTPTVPLPEQFEMVTMNGSPAVPAPAMARLHDAPPVVERVILLLSVAFTPFVSEKVTEYVTLADCLTCATLGALIVTVGGVASVVNVKDRAAEDPTFPAASVWLTVTDLLPSPVVRVQLENE